MSLNSIVSELQATSRQQYMLPSSRGHSGSNIGIFRSSKVFSKSLCTFFLSGDLRGNMRGGKFNPANSQGGQKEERDRSKCKQRGRYPEYLVRVG